MEENFTTSQSVIDNAPDAMHNALESEEEMLKFYLTMNRFVNPLTYNMEKNGIRTIE